MAPNDSFQAWASEDGVIAIAADKVFYCSKWSEATLDGLREILQAGDVPREGKCFSLKDVASFEFDSNLKDIYVRTPGDWFMFVADSLEQRDSVIEALKTRFWSRLTHTESTATRRACLLQQLPMMFIVSLLGGILLVLAANAPPEGDDLQVAGRNRGLKALFVIAGQTLGVSGSLILIAVLLGGLLLRGLLTELYVSHEFKTTPAGER